jgi:esterase/lipase superfamily enzyme
MLLISCRKDGTSDHEMAPTDRIHVLDSPDGSIPLRETRRLRPNAFLRRVRNERVLFLVHGYNTPLDATRRAYRRIARRLGERCPSAYDHVIGFTWPGGASRYAYPWAKARATAAARHLRRWLVRLAPNVEAIDLLCHSLGNYLGHRALKTPTSPAVRYVFAVAPALRLSLLKRHAERQRGQPFEHLYLFYTPTDTALGRWFPIVEWDWAAGYTVSEQVRMALRELNVTVVNCKDAVTGHTGYTESPAFYSFLAGVLSADPVASDRTAPESHGPAAELAPLP